MLIAPAVVWLAAAYGIRRVLVGPAILYAGVSLIIPLVSDLQTLLVLVSLHSLLLGTFVPAAIMIIFRHVPTRLWLAAIAVYCMRVGCTQNLGVWLVGFYMEHLSWHWMYWQDVVPTLLMAWLAYAGCSHQSINRAMVANADWGGMLLFGAGLAMIYVGLDQGNRLDWFNSGIVSSFLFAGVLLLLAFLVNEAVVPMPWASVSVLFSRNIILALAILLLFSLTNLSNTSLVPNFLLGVAQLRPEQVGPFLLFYVVGPMLLFLLLAVRLLKRLDARLTALLGLLSFGVAALLGTRLTHEWVREDFVPLLLLQAVGEAFTLFSLIVIVLTNSDPARAAAFSAYIQVVRLGSAEFGAAALSTWLRVREQMHSNWLGKYVQGGAQEVADALAGLSMSFAQHGVSQARDRGLLRLGAIIRREANVLAYIDGFWLAFAAAALGLLLLAAITEPPAGPLTPFRHPDNGTGRSQERAAGRPGPKRASIVSEITSAFIALVAGSRRVGLQVKPARYLVGGTMKCGYSIRIEPDPLHDPNTWKWIDGPLKPPEQV